MNDKEIRLSAIENIELREEETDGEKEMWLCGYPIVFGQRTLIGTEENGYYEVIDRNAFDNCDMSDVCLRYNHLNGFLVLARTRNKSLELTVDEHGVYMRAKLIPTSTNKDIYLMAQSGLLSQGSFAFTVEDQKIERSEGKVVRNITKIKRMFDVSVVDTPAYPGTEIYARSLEKMEPFMNEPVVEEPVVERMSENLRNLCMLYGDVKKVINL